MTDETIMEQLIVILGEPPTEEIGYLYYIVAIMLVILTIILIWKFISSMINK